MTFIRTSIVLPCYNEKENLKVLIPQIHQYLQQDSTEIIIVDDSSTDGTAQYFEEIKLKNVTIINRLGKKKSLGASVGDGIQKSQGEIIVIMDSDLNHRPSELPIFIENMKFFDCVVASRFVYGGNMSSKFRQISSWLFNIGTRILTKTLITDSLFGYLSIKRKLIKTIKIEDVFYGHGDYCIRLLYYFQKQRVTILQIPGVLGDRLYGTKNKKLFTTLIKYLGAVFNLMIKRDK